MSLPIRIQVFPDAGGLTHHAARTLREACARNAEGRVAVALSGGATPALLYRRLAEDYLHEIPWGRLEVFFGDERAVSPHHADSNYGLALRELLSRVPIPMEQVHRMPAGESDLELAAQCYEEEVQRLVPPGPLGDPAFDLVWLGVGEDGHTASLFPGTATLSSTESLVVANDVPRLGTRRMTFTFTLINAARRVQFLVLGREKAAIVERVLGPPRDGAPSELLPAGRVRPPHGTLEWLLDREAAAGIVDPGLIA